MILRYRGLSKNYGYNNLIDNHFGDNSIVETEDDVYPLSWFDIKIRKDGNRLFKNTKVHSDELIYVGNQKFIESVHIHTTGSVSAESSHEIEIIFSDDEIFSMFKALVRRWPTWYLFKRLSDVLVKSSSFGSKL